MTEADVAAVEDGERPMSREWHWRPEVPIENSALCAWPPKPLEIVRWLTRSARALAVGK